MFARAALRACLSDRGESGFLVGLVLAVSIDRTLVAVILIELVKY